MQCPALGDIGKGRINTFKFHGPQINYALPEAVDAIGGQHGSKIEAVRKPVPVLHFERVNLGDIDGKRNTETWIFAGLKKTEVLISFP